MTEIKVTEIPDELNPWRERLGYTLTVDPSIIAPPRQIVTRKPREIPCYEMVTGESETRVWCWEHGELGHDIVDETAGTLLYIEHHRRYHSGKAYQITIKRL